MNLPDIGEQTMTTNPELNAVKVKIAKLLNLGNNAGASLNEAQVSLGRASQLMEEWGLSLSDIELGNEKIVHQVIETGKKKRSEIITILQPLGNFCNCKIWRSSGKYAGRNRYEQNINILGYEQDVELFVHFYNMIERVLETEFMNYKKTEAYQKQNRFMHGRKIRSTWVYTFCSAVNDTLYSLTDDQKHMKTSSGTALVPLKMGKIEDYFENEMNIRLVNVRYHSRCYGGNAADAGREAGSKVRFNDAVNGKGNGTKLLG